MARDTSSPWTGFPRPKHSLLEGRQDDAGKNCGHQATNFDYLGFTVNAMIVSHIYIYIHWLPLTHQLSGTQNFIIDIKLAELDLTLHLINYKVYLYIQKPVRSERYIKRIICLN